MKLGDSLEVSAIGFGTMGLSGVYGDVDPGDAEKVIHHALDSGVTLLDTADAYGRDGGNEKLVGRAIAGRRDDAVLATKFGYVGAEQGRQVPSGYRMRLHVDGSRTHVSAAVDASLRRLGTDHLDLWFLHFPDPAVPVEETVGAMAEQVGAGKVRHLGLSNVDAAELRAAAGVHPIAAVQGEYSLWNRQAEKSLLPACAEVGAGFVAWGPLGSGFLADARFLERTAEELPRTDFRSRDARFAWDNLAVNVSRFAPLRDIAAAKGCTTGQLALAWLLTKGVVPIPGTRNPAHLSENLAAGDVSLSAQDVAELAERFPAHTAVGATFRRQSG
jgi:aryl-alcohol dehydrogenase-like predicted oxidoreductase